MYSFQHFFDRLDRNWYEDDGLLQQLLARYAGPSAQEARAALVNWGALSAGTPQELAEESARVENRPCVET